MSEVIVRMDKFPTKCFDCKMCSICEALKKAMGDDQELFASSLYHKTENGFTKPVDCPIIGVLPEKHGRLVDAEHFEVVSYTENEIEQAGYCWRSFDDGVEWLLNQVDATPTIVPATECGCHKCASSNATTPNTKWESITTKTANKASDFWT